ncbi:MAG: hypothetical protein WKF75_03750 [Singulisphaera sp.]
MSKGHLFKLLGWGMGSVLPYAVEAMRRGKPVPHTTLGQLAVERCNEEGDPRVSE